MRKCRDCEETLPLSSFGKNSRYKDKLHIYYRDCVNRQGRESKHKDPRLTMLKNARERAKQKGRECTITKDDIVIPTHCPILGHELKSSYGSGYTYQSPTLDRKDPSKGYTPDNVWVICARANVVKSDATSEEIFKVAEAVRKLENEDKIEEAFEKEG